MRSDKRAARRREIEEAAFGLLLEQGYAATSMLSVARRAGASNETLYRWYGDKTGLFRALVEANAEQVKVRLNDALASGEGAETALLEAGAQLVTMLTGQRAVALNRAAAADADQTGALGAALAEAGRGSVGPLLARTLTAFVGDARADEATETYVGLLVGDLQIRRVIGSIGPLTPAEAQERSARALALLRQLYP